MKAVIITIGDELLYGQTVDTNSAWLGIKLSDIGVHLIERVAIGDVHRDIVDTLDRVISKADLIITTGGLGPTNDDITKEALAEFMQVNMTFSQETYDRIEAYLNTIGKHAQDAHRQQCMMPSNAQLLKNRSGTAPGMWFEINGKYVLSLPGVPHEMKVIMEDVALAMISERNPEVHIIHKIIRTVGAGETFISQEISDIVANFPSAISVAYLPGLASVKIRLSAKGKDRKRLEELLGKHMQEIVGKLGRWVYALSDVELPEVLGRLCLEHQLKIGTAESCTGGRVAHLIIRVPGASQYFEGAIVSYSNAIKMEILGVHPSTLEKHGAVSEAIVLEMVQGALSILSVDVAVAISGVAGPGGGSEDKPVGTVWIAVGNEQRIIAKKWKLLENRDLNINYAAVMALNQMRLFIMDALDTDGQIKTAHRSFGIL